MSKYQLKSLSKITLKNAKDKLIEHANKVGIYENFGQEVISYLKDKYEYNPYSHETRKNNVVNKIDQLNRWCMNYSL